MPDMTSLSVGDRLVYPHQGLCTEVRQQTLASPQEQHEWLMRRLQPYRVQPSGGDTQGLLTGYYEPTMAASRVQQGPYQTPLYRLPASLRGGNPWFSRQQMATDPSAQATLRGQEIAWLADPVDALLLQIQGSGRIRLPSGEIVRVDGDGLLAMFGYPVAHEGDVRRAVQAGLDIVRAIAGLAPLARARHGVDLQVRIAVNTGLTLVGDPDASAGIGRLALGDTPNVAARLQQIAAPDTVVGPVRSPLGWHVLRVDGGMVASDWTMQFLADVLGARLRVDDDREHAVAEAECALAGRADAGAEHRFLRRIAARADRAAAASRRPWKSAGLWVRLLGGVLCSRTRPGCTTTRPVPPVGWPQTMWRVWVWACATATKPIANSCWAMAKWSMAVWRLFQPPPGRGTRVGTCLRRCVFDRSTFLKWQTPWLA